MKLADTLRVDTAHIKTLFGQFGPKFDAKNWQRPGYAVIDKTSSPVTAMLLNLFGPEFDPVNWSKPGRTVVEDPAPHPGAVDALALAEFRRRFT